MVHRHHVLLLALVACSRPTTERAPSPVASGTVVSVPVEAGARAAANAAVSRGPHATGAAMSWAFWTRGGAIVSASKTDLWKIEPACAAPQRVPLSIDAMVGHNGVDRFVVERGGAFELWDAATMRHVGPIDHKPRGRGGAISGDGKWIALGGCEEIAADPGLVTSCGELYDATTGGRTAGFVGKHDFETLAFSDDGKYLQALSGEQGLSVFDAATGKSIVTRPRWPRIEEVHGWNRPGLAEIVGDELVVVHGDVVEHVDLTNGRTLGKLAVPGKTLAVFGRKTKRVAVLQGEASRARIWDVASHKVVRTFELAKTIGAGANCRHCAIEIDEVDEERVWLTSAYTNDRLLMHIGTGEVQHVDAHELRSASIASATHRVEEAYDNSVREVRCSLGRRDRDVPPLMLPVEYCNRTHGPSHRPEAEWPYPGFDPSGRFLASIYRSELRLWDIEHAETICTAGTRQ